MAKITVWIAQPHEYEIDDAEHEDILKAIANGDVDTVADFINGIEQTFGAGYFGDPEITGIYDEDGTPLGIG